MKKLISILFTITALGAVFAPTALAVDGTPSPSASPAAVSTDAPTANESEGAEETRSYRAWVRDEGGAFTPRERKKLVNALSNAQRIYGIVTVVETTSRSLGNGIRDYAKMRINELNIGDPEKKNGLYIIIATDDQKVYIQPAEGVAAVVPRSHLNDLIDEVMAPFFRGVLLPWHGQHRG